MNKSPNSDWQACEPGTLSELVQAQRAEANRKKLAMVSMAAACLLLPVAVVAVLVNQGEPTDDRSTATNPDVELELEFDPYTYVDAVNCRRALEAIEVFKRDNQDIEELPENFKRHLERCGHCKEKYEAELLRQNGQGGGT